MKTASSSWEMEAVVAQKDVFKPTKATRAVQELADQLNLEAVKEERVKQMSDRKVEKQREIKELRAENSLLRQNGQLKPSDLASISAPG